MSIEVHYDTFHRPESKNGEMSIPYKTGDRGDRSHSGTRDVGFQILVISDFHLA